MWRQALGTILMLGKLAVVFAPPSPRWDPLHPDRAPAPLSNSNFGVHEGENTDDELDGDDHVGMIMALGDDAEEEETGELTQVHGCKIPQPPADAEWEQSKSDNEGSYAVQDVVAAAKERGVVNKGTKDPNFTYNSEAVKCPVPMFSKLLSTKSGNLQLRVDCSQADSGTSPAMLVGTGDEPIHGKDPREGEKIVRSPRDQSKVTIFQVPPGAPMVSALCSSGKLRCDGPQHCLSLAPSQG